MLIGFTFSNFKSFQEKQTLSLVATKDSTLLEANTMPVPGFGGRRLVRSCVTYGANAAGKSNLIAALDFVNRFVTSSAERSPLTGIAVDVFRLNQAAAVQPCAFELAFIHKGVRYDYGFAVDRRVVRDEWLIAYPKSHPQRWFDRHVTDNVDEAVWQFGPNLTGPNAKSRELTRPDVLYLSMAAKLNHKQLMPAYEWFVQQLRVIRGQASELDWFSQYTAHWAYADPALRARVGSLLRQADLGVAGLEVVKQKIGIVAAEQPSTDEPATEVNSLGLGDSGQLPGMGDILTVRMAHRAQGNQPSVAFPLKDESIGTQRLFSLAGPWLVALDRGFVLAVDELSSSLHPLLVRDLVAAFHNPDLNTNGAQLIFNTHDSGLLDADLFRRDQVWFVEKEHDGASHVYPLTDFHPRRDEALGRGYLRGRYGAIPLLTGASLLDGACDAV